MQVVHKKMEGLGPVHHKNSVHAREHMPVFETVVTAMMEQVVRVSLLSPLTSLRLSSLPSVSTLPLLIYPLLLSPPSAPSSNFSPVRNGCDHLAGPVLTLCHTHASRCSRSYTRRRCEWHGTGCGNGLPIQCSWWKRCVPQ